MLLQTSSATLLLVRYLLRRDTSVVAQVGNRTHPAQFIGVRLIHINSVSCIFSENGYEVEIVSIDVHLQVAVELVSHPQPRLIEVP